MRFEFATAARIVFGDGEARRLGELAGLSERRALVVTGSNPSRVAPLIAKLPHSLYRVPGEPTLELVRRGVEQAGAEGCAAVIAIGGGSAIDAGKAIAALLSNGGDPLDYLEVIGRGQPLMKPAAPFFALPTTAGSGSEVTRNAVLASPEHRVKASLRSSFLLAQAAIVDPELTWSLPRGATASTGIDALTQLIEPYVSCRANAMTDLYCVDGLRRAAGSLEHACENGADREARRCMSWASLLGGLSLANAGLGVVHAFAAPIGGEWNAPHGAICAAILPHGMEMNIEALRRRAPANPALRRYDEIARIVMRQPHAIADDGVIWVADLCDRLEIPRLGSYGITLRDVDGICAKALETSSMKGNPIALTMDEMREIAIRAL
jgi:alcohol dehydrogenase class IV